MLLISSSCVTEKQRAKICAACPTRDSISVRDSLSIHYKDSVIYYEAKDGEDITFVFGEDCDSIKALLKAIQKNPIIKTKNGITSTVKSDGKNLVFEANVDAYRDTIKNLTTLRDFYKFQYEHKETTVKVCENERTWVDDLGRFVLWLNLIALVILGIYVYFRLKRV